MDITFTKQIPPCWWRLLNEIEKPKKMKDRHNYYWKDVCEELKVEATEFWIDYNSKIIRKEIKEDNSNFEWLDDDDYYPTYIEETGEIIYELHQRDQESWRGR